MFLWRSPLFFILFLVSTAFAIRRDHSSVGMNSGKPFLPFLYLDASGTVNCEDEIHSANETIVELGPNWQEILEEKRQNFTSELPQCKQNLNNTAADTAISNFLDYEMDFATCPGTRTAWMVVAMIFIVGFIVSVGALATVSVLFCKLKQNSVMP